MPNTLFLILMYFTEWLIVYSYAKAIYEVKYKFSGILSIALYGALMITYGYIINYEVVNILLTILCNILLIFLCFKSTIKSSFFHGFALGITQLISEVVAVYTISYIAHLPTNAFATNATVYMIDVIISKILYFVISRFFVRFSLKEIGSKSWGRWFVLSVLPVSSVFIMVTIRILTDGLTLSPLHNTLCVLSIILLLISNIVIYMLYERSEKSSQKLIELEITNQKNNIDLQYLNLLEKKNETMQIMSHDYKRHILTIEAMTDSPEVKQYIQEMLGDISEYSQIGKTKNKILDVILSKYTDICTEKSIQFETDILSDNLSFINSADISTLFNNLLDNSVEAAEQSKEKYIYLQITNTLDAYHKIKIINSCDTPPTVKNGKLCTTKQDHDLHGFGIKSIKKTVNKYNGEMQWVYNDAENQFEFTIIIPTVE